MSTVVDQIGKICLDCLARGCHISCIILGANPLRQTYNPPLRAADASAGPGHRHAEKLAPAHRCLRWGCVVSRDQGTYRIPVVAEALQVSNQTVWRMIKNKELEAKRTSFAYEIPIESLRKWIFRTLGMYGAERVCKQAEKNEEISLEISQHLARRVRLYRAENPTLQSDNRHDPHEAVLELHPLLRRLSRLYGGKDSWLRDDLYQEMVLAILSCAEPQRMGYFMDLAEWRAIDVVRKELQRGLVYEPRLRLDECMTTVEAADCSKVIMLFKLAQLPLSLLELFGVYLSDDADRKVA